MHLNDQAHIKHYFNFFLKSKYAITFYIRSRIDNAYINKR